MDPPAHLMIVSTDVPMDPKASMHSWFSGEQNARRLRLGRMAAMREKTPSAN